MASTCSLVIKNATPVSANQLLTIPYVNVYQVRRAEKVKIPLGNGTLSIISVPTTEHSEPKEGGDVDFEKSITFIQVDDVNLHIPLVKHCPCVRVSPWLYFIIASKDILNVLELPCETPDETLELFNSILDQCTDLSYTQLAEAEEELTRAKKEDEDVVAAMASHHLDAAQKQQTYHKFEKVAHHIDIGSKHVAVWIGKGAASLSKQIQKGGNHIKSKIKNKTEKEIDPKWHSRMEKVKTTTTAVVSLSGAALETVQDIAKRVAHEISSAIPKSASESAHLKGTKVVLGAGVVAVADLYDALTDGIKIVLAQTTDSTADIVEEKYGSQAGKVARDSADVIKGATAVAVNIRGIGFKALAKTTAKETLKEMAKEETSQEIQQPLLQQEQQHEQEEEIPTGIAVNENVDGCIQEQQQQQQSIAVAGLPVPAQ